MFKIDTENLVFMLSLDCFLSRFSTNSISSGTFFGAGVGYSSFDILDVQLHPSSGSDKFSLSLI